MQKQARGISDSVNDKKSNVTLVRWKDNKVVTVALTLYGKEPMKIARRYIKDQGVRVEIDQPNAISFYNKTMGGVDRMDQNTGACMINISNKKWWWPLFFSIFCRPSCKQCLSALSLTTSKSRTKMT